MRITKFGHSCVRVEHDGVTVVVDPGVFTDVEAPLVGPHAGVEVDHLAHGPHITDE